MDDLLRRNLALTLGLRLLTPLVAAVVLGFSVAELVGGTAGIAGGAALGVVVAAAWALTGFSGDPARAGDALLQLPPSARVGGEVLVLAASVLMLGLGLDVWSFAAVLTAVALAYLLTRAQDIRTASSAVGSAVAAVPGPAAAGTASQAEPAPSALEWSKRGAHGSFQFGRTMILHAAVDDVWRFVWDFDGLATCIPGCEEVVEHMRHRSYTVRVRKKLGPFLIRMPLNIEIRDHEEARFIRAAIVGRDERMRSEVHQQLDVSLVEVPTGCQLRAVIDVSIQGVLASVDAHLIERNLDQTIGEFTQQLNERILSTTTAKD